MEGKNVWEMINGFLGKQCSDQVSRLITSLKLNSLLSMEENGITYFKFSPQFFSDENSFACYYMLIIVILSLNYSLLNYFFPLLLYNNTKEKKERKKKEI